MAETGRCLGLAPHDEKQTPGIVTLILALASGESVKDAARSAGLAERTVYRRLRSEVFVKRVNQARASMIQQGVGRLAKTVSKASDVLDKLLESGSERIRLQAAKAVMDCSVKLGDANAYEQRLASLESMLEMRLPRRERQEGKNKWSQ